ncbi:MAG: DUF3303 family protein [Phycisphaerae bacterium]|nr:DUF3303 family protein [Phycisphaerae bacterium]
MLFMVIEHFGTNTEAIRARFKSRGRLMPEGVVYHGSWIDAESARCFQVMESATRERLDEWIAAWSDLVRFEVVPVRTSGEFWAEREQSA